MEYLTVEDVYKSVKELDENAKLTETITGFIQEEEAILNGMLSFKYRLPIPKTEATSNARTLLRGIILYKILARLEIFLKLDGGDESQAITDKITYWKMYRNSTAMISKNQIKLDGVQVIDNFVSSNFPKSKFDRDIDQW